MQLCTVLLIKLKCLRPHSPHLDVCTEQCLSYGQIKMIFNCFTWLKIINSGAFFISFWHVAQGCLTDKNIVPQVDTASTGNISQAGVVVQ